MARGVNQVTLLGNLGKDAETRFTASGTAVTNFSVATARSVKDQQSGEWSEVTDWHNVVLWKAEKIAEHLKKGTRVYLQGRLQTRSWDDQNGNKRYSTEVVVNASDVILCGGKRDGGSDADEDSPQQAKRSAPAQRKASTPPADDPYGGITDDDVPF